VTDKEYDRHFKRIRKILSDSGDYDGWKEHEGDELAREKVLDTDTGLILSVPHLNPEFF